MVIRLFESHVRNVSLFPCGRHLTTIQISSNNVQNGRYAICPGNGHLLSKANEQMHGQFLIGIREFEMTCRFVCRNIHFREGRKWLDQVLRGQCGIVLFSRKDTAQHFKS